MSLKIWAKEQVQLTSWLPDKKGKEDDASNQKGFSDLKANTSPVFLGLPTPVLNSYQSDVFFYILQYVKFQL